MDHRPNIRSKENRRKINDLSLNKDFSGYKEHKT